jgi:O-acetylhomoserine/O-acetylserine sulfhydrylase-like pyridoxal-dependent enzyme
MEKEEGFNTRAVHAWRVTEPVDQEPASVPIYQSATFSFDDIETFAAVGKTKISGGYLYTRWANPTTDALARAVSTLEGSEAAACYASGMGTIHVTLSSLARAGDHVVSASQIYGGTHRLLSEVLPRAGIEVSFVDVSDHAAIESAFRDTTRALYCETIGNPTLPVADLEALAEIAHRHGALLVVDATFTTPYLLRALAHGADLVIHSATKYLGGHSDVTGGVVAGSHELVARIRHLGIDLGATLSPFDSWLILRGVQTLGLRMERICESALALASFLEEHPRVERVVYPGLATHPQHELARKLFGDRYGGMVAFEVEGGSPAGRSVLERVRVASAAASLGGTKTLIVHPASVTHTQLSAEQLRAAGISEGMMRVSVGIEDVEDIIDDLDRALR